MGTKRGCIPVRDTGNIFIHGLDHTSFWRSYLMLTPRTLTKIVFAGHPVLRHITTVRSPTNRAELVDENQPDTEEQNDAPVNPP